METSPLVIDEISAGAEFLEKLNLYRPVIAACWMRRSADEERYLYAALDGLTVEDTGLAYLEVLRITQGMKGYIDPFRVRVIGPDHRIARAITDLYRSSSGRVPPRGNGHAIGGMGVEELYIYPKIHAHP